MHLGSNQHRMATVLVVSGVSSTCTSCSWAAADSVTLLIISKPVWFVNIAVKAASHDIICHRGEGFLAWITQPACLYSVAIDHTPRKQEDWWDNFIRANNKLSTTDVHVTGRGAPLLPTTTANKPMRSQVPTVGGGYSSDSTTVVQRGRLHIGIIQE